jgi:hypothetical protein
MTASSRAAIVAIVVLLSASCGQQPAPESTAPAAATAPAATAPAAGAKPAGPAMKVIPLRALSMEDLARHHHNAPLSCNIESISGARMTAAPYKAKAKQVVVSGWFLPEISKKTGTPAFLRLVDENGSAGWDTPILHWTPRPEVITTMKGVDKGNPGFLQPVDLTPLPSGRYQVSVIFNDTGWRSCDLKKVIEIP